MIRGMLGGISIILLTITACNRQLYKFNEMDILENKNVAEIIHVIDTEKLVEYEKANDIPAYIRRTINSWGEEFDIVDSGKKYHSTDTQNGLPGRQIIAIFKNENYFIMTYNHGGRGRHTHIMYFKMTDEKVSDFWVGFGNVYGNELDNIAGVKEQLMNTSGLQTNFVDY